MSFGSGAQRLLGALVVLYLAIIGWTLAFGGFDLSFGPVQIYVTDLSRPTQILALLTLLYTLVWIGRSRQRTFTAVAGVLSLVLFLLLGEGMMRVIYHNPNDGEPGFNRRMYSLRPDGQRWPTATGPKKPGIPRILIQGDSLTWGAPKRWEDLYPNLLLDRLNAGGEKYEMHVIGKAGLETNHHVEKLRRRVDAIDPDIIVYQWFLNDMEIVKSQRPFPRYRFWQQIPSWQEIARKVYLLYVLDQLVNRALPPFNTSYADYLK
ncbi:MAG: hypothetical protein HQK87_09085 [Nitrospinae bacterium]|nr:hypothetical protein [Nitrospinota bacterium]